MSTRYRALLALFIASLFWSTAGVAAKFLTRTFDPFVLTFYRFTIASIILLPFYLNIRHPKTIWAHLILVSLLSAANVILFYLGIKTTTANAAALIYTVTPLAVALLSRLLIGEPVSNRKFSGIIIGLLGVVIIILLPMLEHNGVFVGDLRGNLLISFAVFSWALYTIESRVYLRDARSSPLALTFVTLVTTSMASLLISIFTGKMLVSAIYFEPFNLLWLLYSAIFLTIITFFLYQWVVGHVSAATASLKQYLEATLGVGWNILLLGEGITAGFLLGAGIVFAGLYIATSGVNLVRHRK